MNCPILEQTADKVTCGRCWFYLPDGITCPRHGNVAGAVNLFHRRGGELMLEENHRAMESPNGDEPEKIMSNSQLVVYAIVICMFLGLALGVFSYLGSH